MFLYEFIKSPLNVGAVAPSGRTLSNVATAPVPRQGTPIVVELGPGTGAFTHAIQRRLGGRGRHIAIELNQRFAADLADRHPAVDVVADDAVNIRGVLAKLDIAAADVIVSGLPWAAFVANRQPDLMSTVVQSLKPHGAFTTFAYTATRFAGPARQLRRLLEANFGEVLLGRTVWSNVPPALVYYCRQPIRRDE